MNRRQYVTIAGGAGLAGLGGCLTFPTDSTSNNQSKSDTSTGTKSPTDSPTPEARAPTLETVSLVYSWTEFGDVGANKVDAVGTGAPANIGYRFNADTTDGAVDVTEQVKVYDSSGDRVAVDQHSEEQLVDESGYGTWEHALAFDTSTWDRGEYEAEVIVRDNQLGETSDALRSSFRVTDPLTRNEASLVSVEGPSSVRTGERYDYELNLANESTRDGSVVSTVSARYQQSGEWYHYDFEVAATIPSNGTHSWPGYFEGFDNSGTIVLRLDALGETWAVDVTE